MADYGKAVEMFQQGADWRQRFRANRQSEKARDLALEGGEYDMQSRRANRKLRDPDTAAVLGPLDPNSVPDWGGQLQDPFAFKLLDWFKNRKAKKKGRKQAIDLGGEGEFATSNPGPVGGDEATYVDPTAVMGDVGSIGNPQDDSLDPEAETFPLEGYADGGAVTEEEKIRERARRNRANNPGRVERATETVSGENRMDKMAKAAQGEGGGRLATARRAINFENHPNGSRVGNAARGLARPLARLGAAAALTAPLANQAEEGADERYAKRFNWEAESASEGDPGIGGYLKFLGKRALGYASDVGDLVTGGLAGDLLYRDDPHAAPQQQALPVEFGDMQQSGGGTGFDFSGSSSGPRRSPVEAQAEPEVADFSDLDIDPKEVPDMKTNDWVQYRAQLVDAARMSGRPEAVQQAGDMVTQMQMKGFLSYGQQGLALQQAGNIRGAMAAYRAAFQYFPNGNDVEFGVHRGRAGNQEIIGVGLDEKTGKRVPGSEMVMSPERVSLLLENFTNPQAFRMWTKDWRDERFKERGYQEVTKPLAQAQADSLANNSEAAVLRAENAALRGGGAQGGANMRNAENVFRERLGQMGLVDEAQADYLASVMSQVKAANPQVPDNVIIQTIMTAARDGTLEARLRQMQGGAGGSGSGGAAPQQAIPVNADDPAMVGLSPEEMAWANTPAQ